MTDILKTAREALELTEKCQVTQAERDNLRLNPGRGMALISEIIRAIPTIAVLAQAVLDLSGQNARMREALEKAKSGCCDGICEPTDCNCAHKFICEFLETLDQEKRLCQHQN